jgi:hypothetical protein
MTCSEGSKSETWISRPPRNALALLRGRFLVRGNQQDCPSQYIWCRKLCALADTELRSLVPARLPFRHSRLYDRMMRAVPALGEMMVSCPSPHLTW